MFKLISFDVGIKNLAYCIIEKDNDRFNILDWDIINLLETKNDFKCCAPILSKSKKNVIVNECLEPVKHYLKLNQDNLGYLCKKHLSYCEILKEKHINKNIIDEVLVIDKKLKDHIKCKKCDSKAKYKLIEDHLCKKHYDNKKKLLNKYEIINLEKTKVNELSTDELKFNLIKKLDDIKRVILRVDYVLIENQPTFKNPKMKGLSDTLYTWFMIRGMQDKLVNNCNVSKIMFISPSNKLKDFLVDDVIDEQENDRDKYKATKELGIVGARLLLKKYDLMVWNEHLNNYKKKDDLCDALLQGYYYLNKDRITNRRKLNKNKKDDEDNNNEEENKILDINEVLDNIEIKEEKKRVIRKKKDNDNDNDNKPKKRNNKKKNENIDDKDKDNIIDGVEIIEEIINDERKELNLPKYEGEIEVKKTKKPFYRGKGGKWKFFKKK